jgi:isopentenyl diphosphate isomerase/L-lactate dehydrogenase-like FMN-dependent dehydrogenase
LSSAGEPVEDVAAATWKAVGREVEVLLDGDIRRGSDVVEGMPLGAKAVPLGAKAVPLGAQAVMTGRAISGAGQPW